jgi:hypothetical protein
MPAGNPPLSPLGFKTKGRLTVSTLCTTPVTSRVPQEATQPYEPYYGWWGLTTRATKIIATLVTTTTIPGKAWFGQGTKETE